MDKKHQDRRSSILSDGKNRRGSASGLKIGFAEKEDVIVEPVVEDKDLIKVEAFLSQLSSRYVFSVVQEEPSRYKATFSIPTKEKPIPTAVAQVYINIKDTGILTFQFENRKFEYTNAGELDFDLALDSIIRSKITSWAVGVDLKSDLVLQS